jgi:Ca2+-binding EF-hand superfamily protein
MKKTILILTGCALAIFPLGAEDNTKKPEGRKGPKGDGSFFKQMDKDGDKAISKEEAGERWERLGKLDKDGDGKVTAQEMMAARPGGKGEPGKGAPGKGKGEPGKGAPGKGKGEPGKGAPGKGAPGEMFKRADKNGDGKLTKDEVPEQAWARLSRLDKDGDDAVSQEEAKAGGPPGGPKGKGKGGEFLKRADKNGDGAISKDEVPEQAWERLGKMDKNNDGSVSKEEMEAAFAAMRGQGKGPQKGKGGPQQGGPGALFSRYDKDGDGKIGEADVPAEMWSRLRKADADADGLVSKDELGKIYGERGGKAPGNDAPKKKRPELEKDEA